MSAESLVAACWSKSCIPPRGGSSSRRGGMARPGTQYVSKGPGGGTKALARVKQRLGMRLTARERSATMGGTKDWVGWGKKSQKWYGK